MTAEELCGTYRKCEMKKNCRVKRISSKESAVRIDPETSDPTTSVIPILVGDTSTNPAPWPNSAGTFHMLRSDAYDYILGRLKPNTELEVVAIDGSQIAICMLPGGGGMLLITVSTFLRVWELIKRERLTRAQQSC
jgi:hypothetical protein